MAWLTRGQGGHQGRGRGPGVTTTGLGHGAVGAGHWVRGQRDEAEAQRGQGRPGSRRTRHGVVKEELGLCKRVAYMVDNFF